MEAGPRAAPAEVPRLMLAFGPRPATNLTVMRTVRSIPWFAALMMMACTHPPSPKRDAAAAESTTKPSPVQPAPPPLPWNQEGEMTDGETIVLGTEHPGREPVGWARSAGLLNVELNDQWGPFIFSESDGPKGDVKPNRYRHAFIALANDWESPDEIFLASSEGAYAVLMAAGLPGTEDAAQSPQGKHVIAEAGRALRLQREPNFLEAYGIPPTLDVLFKRIEDDKKRTCYADLDLAGLAAFDGTVSFQSREQAHREYREATGDAVWVEKQIAKQTLRWKGKMIPLPEAQNLIAEAATADRRKLHAGVTEAFKAVADFSESEMNAIYLNKKINDELRNYRTPEEATILAYENEPKVVERLVQEVTAAFPISHRFYKVKAKILKVKRFQYEDRAAIAGKIKQSFAFEDALTLTRSVFESINPYYSETLNSYLRNGQIDIYPRAGKHGGAYCSGAVGKIPTFVLLNHTASLRSTETLAHEMGHAFHTELSKHQPIRYQGYTTSVAEVASTFFEQFVSEAILKKLSEKEKIIALHDRIQGDIQTIFRQIACFNFEKDLHLLIRSKGAVTKEETAALLNKHMKAYLGPLFDMRPDDGYAFVGWPHIRRFFYVYSYAYGQLISKALYARYKANPSYLEKIEQFLKAGCSKSPEQIFTEIGIDVVSPDFWKQGLAQIEADIAQLEKLTHGII